MAGLSSRSTRYESLITDHLGLRDEVPAWAEALVSEGF